MPRLWIRALVTIPVVPDLTEVSCCEVLRANKEVSDADIAPHHVNVADGLAVKLQKYLPVFLFTFVRPWIGLRENRIAPDLV